MEKALKEDMRTDIPMLTGKTLKALTEVDYLARMKIKFSKEDFKECWDTLGLGPVVGT